MLAYFPVLSPSARLRHSMLYLATVGDKRRLRRLVWDPPTELNVRTAITINANSKVQVGRVTASVKPLAENQNDEAHSAHSGTCSADSYYPSISYAAQVPATL